MFAGWVAHLPTNLFYQCVIFHGSSSSTVRNPEERPRGEHEEQTIWKDAELVFWHLPGGQLMLTVGILTSFQRSTNLPK